MERRQSGIIGDDITLTHKGGVKPTDTKDIALFLTVAKTESVSRAAEELYMSQSTVTTHIQRLEKALGYPLFLRLPSGVKLTMAGERLLPLAERMLGIEREMYRPRSEDMPWLRVMSGRAFISTDVPACLSRMTKALKVRLDVRMGLYDEMQEALLREQVDFCFMGEPIYHAKIKRLEFTPDPIDMVVPAKHHFVHNFSGIQAIANEPFIAFSSPSAPFRRRVTRLLAEENVYPNVRMELDSIDGIKAMVSQGLGISFLPRRTLFDAEVKNYQVIPIPLAGWTRPTLIHYPAAREDLPLTKQFLEIVSAYYREKATSS